MGCVATNGIWKREPLWGLLVRGVKWGIARKESHRIAGTSAKESNEASMGGIAMRSGGAFSDEEIQLLRGLPAVSNVTRDRITYSDTFRQVCTIRYLAGESPTKIFREAGLPPELVGYKRIERSVARWKEAAIKSVNGSDTMTDGEIIAQLAARYKRALATRRSLEDIANTATEPKPAATAASNDVHPLSLGLFDGDTAGIIIRQQARRIDELERDVVRLRNKLDKEVGPNPASAEA